MDADLLYDRILARADLGDVDIDNGGWITRAELQQLCLDSFLELLDIKVSLLGTEAPWLRDTYAVPAAADSVSIPDDDGVYRVLRIDLQSQDGSWMPLQRGVIGSDVLDGTARTWRDGADISYYLTRGVASDVAVPYSFPWTVYFDPPSAAAATIRVWYVPVPALVLGGAAGVEVTEYPNEHPEFVVEDVCSKIAYKGETDARPFEGERERIRLRIERYTKPHQMTQPQLINDQRSLQYGRRRTPAFMRRRP
jgi:hypothetical protein